MRTADSRTYVGPDGTYEAQISQTPINFQNAQGVWTPINNTLTQTASGAFANKANAFRVQIPARLSAGAVSFSVHGARVADQIEGASSARAHVTGDQASFMGVFSHVNETLSAKSSSLVDELTLHGAGARSTFRYRLALSEGLTPRLRRGVIAFVDRQGKTVVSYARPFMYDKTDRARGARPVRVALHHQGGRWVLVLRAGSSWLRRALAVGDRVVIDPQTDPGLATTQSCTLDGSAVTTSECAASVDNIGWDGTHSHNTLLEFNVQGSVPRDVQVLGTRVDTTITAESTSTPVAIGAYPVSKPWTTAATWNTTNGTTAWTTGGGDVGAIADTETVGGAINTPARWYPLALVQGWVDGTTPNYGVELKATSTSTTNELSVNNADLYVYYEPRQGAAQDDSFTSFQLSDHMSAGVNDANGNLLIKDDDLQIQGTGLSLVVDRYYNNLDGGTGFGLGDLYPNTDSPFIYYYGPSGDDWSFRKNTNGTFTSPAGLNDTLVENNAGQYTLTDNDNQVSTVYQGEFGGNFVPTAMKDQNSNTITYTYNTVDQASYADPPQVLESITDTQGRKITVATNSDDDITQLTDSTGRTWKYAYNSDDDLTSYIDPLGNTTTYTYNSYDDPTQITSPGGRITKFAYVNEAGGDYRVSSVTQVTNNGTGAGNTTSFSYSSTPAGPCLSTDYTETVVTDPLGYKTTYCNNPRDAARVVYDPLGHQHNYMYDVDGNVLQLGTGTGSTVSKATYNANNDPISATDPTNVSSTIGYADSSHPYYPTSVTDGQGSKLSYGYYASGATGSGTGGGNLKSITDNTDASPIFSFSYNANGTLASETDQPTTGNPSGDTTAYGYDSKGNLLKVTPTVVTDPTSIAQFAPTVYVPDGLSRVSSVTDGVGHKTSYTYDALDRLTKITYADGSTITNTYDNDGNLTKQVDSAGVAADETGTETWTYNQLNQITQITLPGGQTSTYTYDADGDLTSLTDSTGTTTYGYNAGNQLVSLAIPGGSCTSSPTSGCATFAYDANGNRTTTNLPNGVVQTGTDDADGHVLTLQAKNSAGTILDKYTYTYTKSGTPTDLVQTMVDKDGNTTTYTYDTRDRLTKAATTGPAAATDTYAYDANNNRVSSTDKNGTYTYAYNGDNELCWKASGTVASPSCTAPPAGAVTYGYDADGNNTTQGTSPTLAYNDRGQMSSFATTAGTDDYSYQGPGQNELTQQGSLIYQNELLGPAVQTGGQYGPEDYVREPDGQLFSTYSDGQRTYPLFDGQGSLADISNSTGGSDGYFTYDPYGQQLTAVGQDFNNQFGYDGGQNVEGSFIHFGARFYNAVQGRFSQADPQAHPDDPANYNPFVFAGDDPTTDSDPTGQVSVSQACAIVLTVLTIGCQTNAPLAPLESAPVQKIESIVTDFTDAAGDVRDTLEDDGPGAVDFLIQAADYFGIPF